MTSAETWCVCGVRLTWPQPLGVVGWLWRADMEARAKAHADCVDAVTGVADAVA